MKVTHHHALWAWMQYQNLCLTDSLVLGRQKNILLGDGRWGDVGSSFIDCNRLMPNRPHECKLFAIASKVPHMWPVKLVILREVALPLVCCPRHVGEPINDFIAAHHRGIVQKEENHPPTSNDHNPTQAWFLCLGRFSPNLFLLTSSGINDFDMIKQVNHITYRFLPFIKAPRVGIHCIALDQ